MEQEPFYPVVVQANRFCSDLMKPPKWITDQFPDAIYGGTFGFMYIWRTGMLSNQDDWIFKGNDAVIPMTAMLPQKVKG